MINPNVDSNLLLSILSDGRLNSAKNHIISSCPFCDKKDHFYVNVKNKFGVFDCKKCSTFGGLNKLLKQLNREDLIYKYSDNKLNKLSFNKNENNEIIDLTSTPISTPVGYRRLFHNDYLDKRGFSDTDYSIHEVGQTKLVFKLTHYIIFPVYENKKCFGWVGRCVLSNEQIKEAGLLRYMNSRNSDFSKLLYGIDDLNYKTDTVILTEGVFDKIAVDRKLALNENDEIKCCCTFGKKVSMVQIKKLMNLSITNIILMFDLDAFDELKKYGFELSKHFNVKICSLPNKDPDECSVDELVDSLLNLKDVFLFSNSTVKTNSLKLSR